MPSHRPAPGLLLGLALLASTAGLRAETPQIPAGKIQLPAYEVNAPKFTSAFRAFYEKIDNLFDAPWVDAWGSPLIQAIVWRHGYLQEHPSDEAIILVGRQETGAVGSATTIYTANGKLYANSYALGEHVTLRGLTAADIHDVAKIQRALGGIQGQYELIAAQALADFRAEGSLSLLSDRRGRFIQNNFLTVSGAYTVDGGHWNPSRSFVDPLADQRDTGQIVPNGLNMFYSGGLDTVWSDRFHQPYGEMLDTVYRTLHDPGQAGLVPVAISRMNFEMQSVKGTVRKPIHAVVFDWDGVHYVYRPYAGTVGHPIPRNPVTGLPYLCVRDGGLIESIYFSATYRKAHPDEKVTLVSGANPSAAYTLNGKLCVFSPSLNQFALLTAAPATIDDPAALDSSVNRMKAALAARPPAAARSRRARRGHLIEELPGDTPDLQMRRVFVAFQEAGIPVHLKSGPTSSLDFTWEGVNYAYGPDQQLRRI